MPFEQNLKPENAKVVAMWIPGGGTFQVEGTASSTSLRQKCAQHFEEVARRLVWLKRHEWGSSMVIRIRSRIMSGLGVLWYAWTLHIVRREAIWGFWAKEWQFQRITLANELRSDIGDKNRSRRLIRTPCRSSKEAVPWARLVAGASEKGSHSGYMWVELIGFVDKGTMSMKEREESRMTQVFGRLWLSWTTHIPKNRIWDSGFGHARLRDRALERCKTRSSSKPLTLDFF